MEHNTWMTGVTISKYLSWSDQIKTSYPKQMHATYTCTLPPKALSYYLTNLAIIFRQMNYNYNIYDFTSCVTQMLPSLNWQTLDYRRLKTSIIVFKK